MAPLKRKRESVLKFQNGRIIDKDGVQYKKLIKNGYILNSDGTQLVKKPNWVPSKVRNPDTGRMINKFVYKYIPKTNTVRVVLSSKFKQLNNKYYYDDNKGLLVTTIFDPKQIKT